MMNRMLTMPRRGFLKTAGAATGTAFAAPCLVPSRAMAANPIVALTPGSDNNSGCQFVAYGDCCSGVAGTAFEANHRRVNQMLARLAPQPEFVVFLGDAVAGYTKDYAELERQWRYWHDTEMAWLRASGIPLYQCTSNHDTYDPGSEEVFRKLHPEIPRNGPPGLEGLAYCVRRGPLLLVATHQPDRTSYRQDMEIDHHWLDSVLATHADATFKLVIGHFPVFPVNGYARYLEWPMWRLRPGEGAGFWDVLVRHQVNAYLTSHVIAFDVQVHQGVLQILSGGAGTNYGPGGFMPGGLEYHHAVQFAMDRKGLRYQVLDPAGAVRERLTWPFHLPDIERWSPVGPGQYDALRPVEPGQGDLVAWRFRGKVDKREVPGPTDRTLLVGWDDQRGDPTVWIGFERDSNRLVVRLASDVTYGAQQWSGPGDLPSEFDFQVAMHPGMGPGGVLYRRDTTSPWSSFTTGCCRGVDALDWPRNWAIGQGPSGPDDRPFRGSVNLTVASLRT